MGPLAGIRVVEMSNIGPAPFCGMLLADLGATVLSVQRMAAADLGLDVPARYDFLNRGKQAVAVDLKAPDGVALVRELIAGADILIEGFRPGVMERLGLGPDLCHADNPRLIYGRMTGWGQEGPLRDRAGHDINYIAMTGALAAIGPQGGDPVVPLNLIGDFGGGSMFLAMGLMAALVEQRASGKGQVIDAAMVDGVGALMAMHYGYRQAGIWSLDRGTNAVDGGAPWYATYPTSDGRHMAVGAVEKRFYLEMLSVLGLDPADLPRQHDARRWPELREILAARFRTRTRGEWEAAFAGTDACVSPVLDMDECTTHPMAIARGMFRKTDGVTEPAAAPRFSRTACTPAAPPPDARSTTAATLADWGLDSGRIAALGSKGIIPA